MYDVIDGARVGVLTTGATATDLNEVRRHFRSVVSLIPRPDTRERETVIAAGLAYAHVDVTVRVLGASAGLPAVHGESLRRRCSRIPSRAHACYALNRCAEGRSVWDALARFSSRRWSTAAWRDSVRRLAVRTKLERTLAV